MPEPPAETRECAPHVLTMRPADAEDGMAGQRSGRPTASGIARHTLSSALACLAGAALLLVVTPSLASAQMGMLKKLKKAVSAPDSSARAKDSLAQIAAGVLPESVKVGKGSLLQRSGSVVSTASGALEQTTGISAKDAALAATGVGASNLIAKKMGVDPMSIGKAAVANAKMNAQQRAMQKAAGGAGMTGMGTGIGGLAGMPDAATIQAMRQSMAAAGSARARSTTGSANVGAAGVPGLAGFTQADAEALVAFQQEMMTVAMAASAGDERAIARLDAWQALTLKHQAEIEQLSLTASAGDPVAVQKLQQMQFTIMKEWASTAGTKNKLQKSKRP